MDKSLLHTPEGVRDIYRDECLKKIAVQDGIKKVFHLFGYEDIETPTFEFFDIFTNADNIPKKDKYRRFLFSFIKERRFKDILGDVISFVKCILEAVI